MDENQGSDQGTPGSTLTPEQAQARISEIRADKTHFYNTPSPWDNRANQVAKDEVEGLYKIAYPEGDRQSVPEDQRGLHDIVSKEFVSKEHVENQAKEFREKIESEKFDRQVLQSETELRLHWGGEEAYQEKLGYAYMLKDHYLKSEADKAWLSSAAGNDVDLIRKLSDLGEHILKTYHKDEFQKGAFKNYMKTRKEKTE